jgi:hypothetical protein
LLLLLHRKPEIAPWLLCSPLTLGHSKLAYGWWREPVPFLGDSLWVCRIRLGVSSESTDSMKEGLRCFAQGCLWRRSRMKTWDPSYRCAGFSSCRLAQGACTKIVCRVVSDVIYFILYSIFVVWKWYYVIATDPGTITRVQGVGFLSPKTRVVTPWTSPEGHTDGCDWRVGLGAWITSLRDHTDGCDGRVGPIVWWGRLLGLVTHQKLIGRGTQHKGGSSPHPSG